MRNKSIANKFVSGLIEKMTIEEKVGQINQKLYGWECFEKKDGEYILTDKFKEHVKWGQGIGALYGLFRADPWSGMDYETGISKEDSIVVSTMIQDYIKENTRLKIPVLFSEECPHGHQALDGEIYPCNIGVGSTWNPNLVEKVASDIAIELKSKGANLGLISTLDIARDPRWGRTEESYGEDPYLASKLSDAIVLGMQGDPKLEMIPNDKIGTIMKVICAHGGSEGGHNSATSNIGERELREIHLPPVKSGSKQRAIGAMAAYNEIDGVPCHANRKILTEIVKEDFGFEGFIMADGGALDRLLHFTPTIEHAAKLGLEAGVDLSLWDDAYLNVASGIEKGIINEATLDKAVARILMAKYRLGLFEEEQSVPMINLKDQQETNKQIARESLVLLKNNGVLPLSKDIKKIAVIGPNADTPYNQLGDYTPPKRPGDVVTVLDGIKAMVSKETEVNYAHGCYIRSLDTSEFDEAIACAKNSDVVVLVLGGSSARKFDMEFHENGAVTGSSREDEMNSGENVDLANLDLDGVQKQLYTEIQKLGKKLVTVLIQGRPHTIEEIKETSDSILCAWYPGQQGGHAIADILFGNESPSGKLSISIPRHVGQLPVFYNKKKDGSKEDYVDITGSPSYPFGFGLSYTDFEYSDIRIEKKTLSRKALLQGETFKIQVDVKNIGRNAGKEVVQLYINDMEATTVRRIKELKGFNKKNILSGETVTFDFKLGIEELSVWDINMNFSLEPGNVKLMVGSSSEDIEFTDYLAISE